MEEGLSRNSTIYRLNQEPSEVDVDSDVEIEEILQGLNFGTFGTTEQSEAARKKELDEVINELRWPMSTSDILCNCTAAYRTCTVCSSTDHTDGDNQCCCSTGTYCTHS